LRLYKFDVHSIIDVWSHHEKVVHEKYNFLKANMHGWVGPSMFA
jgi:hypothetical protein